MAIKVLNEFLPVAEEVRLGGVKVGDTLSIDDGVLNTNIENAGIGGNRLTFIDIPFSLAASGGILTVYSGGKVYIPNGFESDETTPHFDEYTLTKNYTRNDTLTTNAQYMVVYDRQEDGIRLRLFNYTVSGAIMPTGSGDWFWYDTANNKVKAVNSGTVASDDCSLPLGIIKTNASGAIDSGVQWFNRGFGFIGNELFCLPGIHGVYPYGVDINNGYLPQTMSFVTSRVLTATISTPYGLPNIYLNDTTITLSDEYYYNSASNFNRHTTSNQILLATDTGSHISTDQNGKINGLVAAIVYATAYEGPYTTGKDYYGMHTNYLAANKGHAICNSISNNGDYIAFDRYKSQNGVFTMSGYERRFMINYTSDAIINANLNQVTHSLKLLDEDGNTAFPGNVAANGVIEATTAAALWADLAEKYVSDVKYPIGTLVCFGGEKEITIAKKKANGVISEKPGFVLNKKGKGQPVALVGRVKVRVIGKVNKNDKLVLYKDGVARKKKWYDIFKTVIGITLESNTSNNEKLVMSIVQLAI